MLRDNDPEAIDAELASVRIGRFLEPDEIAASIAFLARARWRRLRGPGAIAERRNGLQRLMGAMDADTPATTAIAAAGIPHRVVRTERAGSAEEAARLQGVPFEALLRTIVVRRGDDDYVFVLVPAGRRFDWPDFETAPRRSPDDLAGRR